VIQRWPHDGSISLGTPKTSESFKRNLDTRRTFVAATACARTGTKNGTNRCSFVADSSTQMPGFRFRNAPPGAKLMLVVAGVGTTGAVDRAG